jgi:hypothetical protein
VRLRALAIAIALCCLVACGGSKAAPEKPLRTPTKVDDVTGIWRSIHQNTLELRRNGTFVLITSVSEAMAGDYSLSQDRMTFFNTKTCGGAQGTYRVQVAPQDHMLLTEADDTCAARLRGLTSDPFVYAS